MQVTHDTEKHEFTARDGDLTSRLRYRMDGNVMDIQHTEVPKELAGHGIATELARVALAYATLKNHPVRPTCPFVRDYLQHHPGAATLAL